MKLKVCGMKYQDNIKDVAGLKPDYMGFIFYQKSPRYFDKSIPKIDPYIQKVGVFVNTALDHVIDMVQKHKLDIVQLHGEEDATYCAQLKFEFHLIREHWKENIWDKLKEKQGINEYKDIKIIKVFSVGDTFQFDKIKPFEKLTDYYLFDTKGELQGGNGYEFNWKVLEKYPSSKPFFLSGGIGLDTTAKLASFRASKAAKYCVAVDVNSKFETSAAYKDINVLKKFKATL